MVLILSPLGTENDYMLWSSDDDLFYRGKHRDWETNAGLRR
jgi:hypothetical protein